MSKKDLLDITKSEYDVLRVLWKMGTLSVREVHDQVCEKTGWAYTTTKTTMDRMVTKGLALRENFHGVNIYKPLISRPMGLVRMVEFFADRVLELDTESVVSLFAKSKAISEDEIEELKVLLKENRD